MTPQDSQNCGRYFAKRKQTDAEFAGNSLLRMVIIDIESNTSLGGLTPDPAGMHCPAGEDAFVLVFTASPILRPVHSGMLFEQRFGCLARHRTPSIKPKARSLVVDCLACGAYAQTVSAFYVGWC